MTHPDPVRPATQALARLRDAFVVAWCASLVGGLGEIALILGARVVLQRYTLLNPQGLWLAPLANFAVIAPPTLLAFLIVRRWRPEFALGAAVGVAAFLAVVEPLLVLQGRLHIAAILLLAAGAAVQLALIAKSRPWHVRRWVARGALALSVVAAAGGLGFNGLRAWRERGAIARLPAASPDAPNVLLLVLDTVRALSLSAYGYGRPTSPVLARLAARGVRFDRAVSTAPWTLPTHASLFTGRYPHELSTGWSTPLDGTFPTLAERLTTLGYVTAGFAANFRYCSYEFGIDRGFAYYRDYDVSLTEMWRSSALARAVATWFIHRRNGYNAPGRLFADRMNARLLDWVDDDAVRPEGRPFFAFVNYYDAHGPYAPPAPYDTAFGGKEPPTRDSGSRDFTAEEVAGLIDAYDGSIAYLDRQIGELFAALERRGLLENTIIIVTSDHGEEFNEHGQMNHGNTLYFPSLHVPLIVAGRGVPSGVGVMQPVTLRDVPATILDLVGAPAEAALPGESLAARWRSNADSLGMADSASPVIGEVDHARNLPSSIPVSQGSLKSVVANGHHFILGADGAEELYDIVRDPWERRNVLSNDSLQATLDKARSLVRLAQQRDVRRGANRPQVSR